MSAYEIAVDPERLVIVDFLEGDQHKTELVALSCGYVPVTLPTGQRRIAVEIVFDPANQQPMQVYYCLPSHLVRRHIPPSQVYRVRPYALATSGDPPA